MTVAMAPVARLRIRRRGARGDHGKSRRMRGHATDRISCAGRISPRRRRHSCDATRRPHAAFTKRPPRRLGGPLESLACRRMLPAAGPSQADGRDACIPASSFRAPSPDEPGGHSEAIPKRPRIPVDGPIPTGPSTPIVVPRGGPGSLKSGKSAAGWRGSGPGWSPPPRFGAIGRAEPPSVVWPRRPPAGRCRSIQKALASRNGAFAAGWSLVRSGQRHPTPSWARGGIGRRSGLKIRVPPGSEGSSPSGPMDRCPVRVDPGRPLG